MTSLASLFGALEAVGIGLDVESARDAVWFAAQLAEKGAAGLLEGAPATTAAPITGAPAAPIAPPTAAAATTGQRTDAVRSRPVGERAIAPSPQSAPTLSRVRLPLAAGLSGERGVPGALRPLRRKQRSPAAGAIDEVATVRRATEDDLWLPVYRPVAERWLELALVVDEALSMLVWHEVARELRRVFRRAAAFRDVRVWRLATEDASVTVQSASSSAGGAASRTDRCPFGGGRRGLVLVMTDCVSDGWYDGRVVSLLERWSRDAPVALLQVLPERMWPRTALGETIAVTLRAAITAMTNPHLHWSAELPVPQAGWRCYGAGVSARLALFPVATAEPASLRRLARMVAGISRESMTGVLFDMTAQAPLAGAPAASPSDHVQRFWSVSSSAAAELASLLSAAPVQSTGMLRLLRRELLPSADASTEAEVLLSGLLVAPKDAGVTDRDLPLEFVPGVRQLLLENAPIDRVLEVLRRVAARVPIPGIMPLTFESWIVNPSAGAEQLQPGNDPVAARVADVLGQIGGAYARIVHPDARPERVYAEPETAGVATGPDVAQHAATDANAPAEPATGKTLRTVRIFVSSPGDTHVERDLLRDVVASLNASAALSLDMRLELVSWETTPAMVATPQQFINQQSMETGETADVFVGIMSRRYGTAMPDSARSGTEEEFRRALHRFRATGRPRILYYFDDSPTSNVGDLDVEQYRRVLQFRDDVMKEGIVGTYAGPSGFRSRVEPDLIKVLHGLASEPTARLEPHIDPHFARVEPFIDREDMLGQLSDWWERETGAPPVLSVSGPAGIGKTALAAEWLAGVAAAPRRGRIFAASAARPVEDVLQSAIAYFSGRELRQQQASVRELPSLLGTWLVGGRNLIVLDDFDSSGGEDIGVWEDAVRLFDRTAARLLLFGRYPVPREWVNFTGVSFVHLGALDLASSVELLRRRGAPNEPGAPASLLDAIARRANGNPETLCILADALADALRGGTMTFEALRQMPYFSSPIEVREWLEPSAERRVANARQPVAQSVACAILHTSEDLEWVSRLRAAIEPHMEGRATVETVNISVFDTEPKETADFDEWLERQHVLGVMISDELLRSPFYDRRVRRRLENLAAIVPVPIIVRPCEWQSEKWIVTRRVLAANTTPLSQHAGGSERAIGELSGEMIRVIEEVRLRLVSAPDRERRDRPRA